MCNTVQNNPRLKFNVTITTDIVHMDIDNDDSERGTVSGGEIQIQIQNTAASNDDDFERGRLVPVWEGCLYK